MEYNGNFKGFRKENGNGFANLEMDYGKEIQFSTMSKWIMERIRGFNSGVLGFKGFIMEKEWKKEKLWKRMPTLGSRHDPILFGSTNTFRKKFSFQIHFQ